MRHIRIQALSDKHRLRMFFLASIILLYFVFAPGAQILYYGGEDLRYAVGGINRLCKQDDGFFFMKTLGRPLQAYLDCMVYKFTPTIQHMVVVRTIAVVLLGIGMGLLADWLYTLGFAFWTAFFAAGSLFLIQKLYSDTVLIGAVSLPIPILLVILGYRCLSKAQAMEYNFISANQIKKQYFYAAIFFFCALLTYPALTFFFGTLVLIKLLFSNIRDWEKNRRLILQDVLLFAVVCIIYFAWASYNMQHHPRAPVPPQYRMHLNLNFHEIMQRILPLTNVFNDGPWSMLFPLGFPLGGANLQGWVTIILLSGALILGSIRFLNSHFYSQQPRIAWMNLLQIIFFVFAVLVLSSGFYLIIPVREDMGSRLVFASVASGFPLLFWSIYRWSDICSAQIKMTVITIMIGLVFFLESYQANIKVMYDALYFSQKLSGVQKQINQYLITNKKLTRIHFVIPDLEYAYNKFFLANAALVQLAGVETYKPQWCSLPRGVLGNEPDHEQEMLNCLKQLSASDVAITYTRLGEHIKMTKNMLVIKDHHEMQDVFHNLRV